MLNVGDLTETLLTHKAAQSIGKAKKAG